MTSNLFTHRMQFVVLMVMIIAGVFFLYLEYTNQSITNFSFAQLFTADYNIIRIGDVSIQVEVANTPQSREKGLSGRSDLGEKGGLLFVFPKVGYHGIWMKDMRFPIDVIWISEDFVVVDITRNLTPDSYPKVFEPSKPVKYALETEVLFAETFNIRVGQKVSIPEALQDSQ
jgi:uncharacterized protein